MTLLFRRKIEDESEKRRLDVLHVLSIRGKKQGGTSTLRRGKIFVRG